MICISFHAFSDPYIVNRKCITDCPHVMTVFIHLTLIEYLLDAGEFSRH